jgi:hypothetical protein
MFPLNTIIAWSINIIMNKKYDNNNIIINSRAYFLQQYYLGCYILDNDDSYSRLASDVDQAVRFFFPRIVMVVLLLMLRTCSFVGGVSSLFLFQAFSRTQLSIKLPGVFLISTH